MWKVLGGVVAALVLSATLVAQTLKCDCTVFTSVVTPTVSVGNGTAGAPSIFATSDATHGFYHVSSALFGLSAGLEAGTDNTYDLGTVAANRFRSGFFAAVLAAAKVQVGAGAATTSNVTLRSSDAAGVLSVELGDESALGQLKVGKIAAGTGGDTTWAATHTTLWNYRQTYTGGDPATTDYFGENVNLSLTPSGNTTKPFYASWVQVDGTTTRNFVTVGGLYATTRTQTSGTITTSAGVTADGEVGGSAAATTNIGLKALAGGFGTATATNNRVVSVETPFKGGTITNHYGLYIDDQTLAATTIDNAFYYNAPSSHAATIDATGLTGLWGAATTALSPLRVGGTLSTILTNNGNSGTTKTIDLSTGNVQRVTLTGNVTFTLNNPVDGGQYTFLIYTGAGGFTATWPAAVKWPSATAPIITATAARMDMIRCTYDGTAADYFCLFSGSVVFTP